jgi:homoserine O-acetyltransferase
MLRKAMLFCFPLGWGSKPGYRHLLGAGKLLDTTNFFIIAVDAFGNGVSSSPSNSGAARPKISTIQYS